MQKYQDYLISWLANQVKKTNTNGLIVGISGGIDSALVGALIKKACPNNSLGLIMPIGQMDDLDDAKLVIKNLDLQSKQIDLTKVYETMLKTLSIKSPIALMNIKPRLRMTTLYALAQELNYLVVGTDNRDEWFLGYFTKYGDGGVDLAPIIHLTKHEVKIMAKQLNICEKIINKVPSAGLFPGQTDESELGFTYDMVDKYLKNQAIPLEIKQKIEAQNTKTAHKRNPILVPLHPQKF